ncbi:hypothetical protein DL96DRAFT_569332 [Flagelloscypha sp. PMI_526]|nr:hypothetical protein DL96DRAFT_569332 [Flagelloscypha sp. PMI_526]
MISPRQVRILVPVFAAIVLLSLVWSSTRLSLDESGQAWHQNLLEKGTSWLGMNPVHEDFTVELDDSAAPAGVSPPPKHKPPTFGVGTPHHIPSSQLHKPTTSQSFHDKLSLVDAYPAAKYGPETLSVFQRIWVLTLEGKKDREQHMSTLASALNLNFTYHFGRNPFERDEDRKALEDIGTYTHWFREQAAYKDGEQELNGLGRKKMFKFEWSEDAAPGSAIRIQHDDLQGADLWVLPDGDPRKPQLPPDYPRYRLESNGKGGLKSIGRPAPEGVYDDSEMWPKQDWNPMDPGKVACFLSHYELIRKIAESEEEGPQLILEDDVDMEWDIDHRLRQMWQHLPPWDFVYLGHCFAEHGNKPSIDGTPYIRPMGSGMCTHAYAITPHGARRLVRFLRSPLFAFGRPIDHITMEMLHGFSRFLVEPPIVVQMPKDLLPSSIGTTELKQWLADSVFQRVLKVSGQETGKTT